MTDEQIEVCKALGKVTCLPASFDKRMCRTMFFKACDTPEQELSEKQNEWIYRLLYKYRRQVPNTYEKYKTNEYCNRAVAFKN